MDTIEQALKPENMPVGNEGYLIAYAVAEDNLRAGNIVIADSVNPIPITRDAWQDVAIRNNCKFFEIETICSDKEDHKRRVETRKADITGHKLPTWQEVIDREYDDWKTKNLVIDTFIHTTEKSVEILVKELSPLLNMPNAA
jgi:predicted kinase